MLKQIDHLHSDHDTDAFYDHTVQARQGYIQILLEQVTSVAKGGGGGGEFSQPPGSQACLSITKTAINPKVVAMEFVLNTSIYGTVYQSSPEQKSP